MSKHTPGPWKMVRVGETLTIKGAVPGYFAEIRGACEAAHGATGEANAHLIAAAPDLLAALQEYARLTSPEYGEGCKRGEHLYPDVDLAAARKAALAAIAKATGGDHE